MPSELDENLCLLVSNQICRRMGGDLQLEIGEGCSSLIKISMLCSETEENSGVISLQRY